MIKSLLYFFCFVASFVNIEAKPCYTCIQSGGGDILGGYGGGYGTYGSHGGYSSYHSGYSGGSSMMGHYLQGVGEVVGVDLLSAALIPDAGVANGIHQQISGGIWDGRRGFHHDGGFRHGGGFRQGGGYRHAGGFRNGGGFALQGFQQGFQESGGFRQGGGSEQSDENGISVSVNGGGQNPNVDKKTNIYHIGNGHKNNNTVNIYLNKDK